MENVWNMQVVIFRYPPAIQEQFDIFKNAIHPKNFFENDIIIFVAVACF